MGWANKSRSYVRMSQMLQLLIQITGLKIPKHKEWYTAVNIIFMTLQQRPMLLSRIWESEMPVFQLILELQRFGCYLWKNKI